MERFLTVSYKPGDRRWPSLRIQGRWVMLSGFKCGDKVRLIVRDREILIRNISQTPAARENPARYVQGDLY